MKFTKLSIIILLFLSVLAFSQEKTADELAKASQNPLANMMSFPLQNNTTFGHEPFDRSSNTINFQPVLPFFDGKLITRTIIPFVSQPIGENENISGVGDINVSLFYTPAPKNGLTWGVGPVILIPTGSDVSSDKLSLGGSVLVLKTSKKWVYGFLVNNVWSVSGDEKAKDVNSGFLQYFINYNIGDGWYLATGPIITINWEAAKDDQLTVPFGGGAGKVMRMGKIPVNLQAQIFYNVVKPDGYGDMSLRLQAQFLFPK